MQSRPQTLKLKPRPDDFFETETEIETGKFRDLMFETETRNNQNQDRDRDRKFLPKYSSFLIVPKTINFFFLNSNLKLHFN